MAAIRVVQQKIGLSELIEVLDAHIAATGTQLLVANLLNTIDSLNTLTVEQFCMLDIASSLVPGIWVASGVDLCFESTTSLCLAAHSGNVAPMRNFMSIARAHWFFPSFGCRGAGAGLRHGDQLEVFGDNVRHRGSSGSKGDDREGRDTHDDVHDGAPTAPPPINSPEKSWHLGGELPGGELGRRRKKRREVGDSRPDGYAHPSPTRVHGASLRR